MLLNIRVAIFYYDVFLIFAACLYIINLLLRITHNNHKTSPITAHGYAFTQISRKKTQTGSAQE
jgi:surface polysaccharide O-acyltransferase-like enzyme